MIIIIDLEIGNTGSISNMLKLHGVACKISNKYEDIEKATKMILPGVGTFDRGMEKLTQFNLVELINHKVLKEKIPILGICLGMQLLFQGSEEFGGAEGLGLLEGLFETFHENGELRTRGKHKRGFLTVLGKLLIRMG